jgi:hypothetical protein
MRKDNLYRRLFCLSLLLVAVLGCWLPLDEWFGWLSREEKHPQVAAMRLLEDASEISLEISFENGFPVSVIGSIPAGEGDAVTQALNFLNTYADLFHLDSPDLVLRLLRVNEGDQTHVSFYQTYQDIPVYAAQMVISLNGSLVTGSSGKLLYEVELDINPALTSLQAEGFAREVLEMPAEAIVIGQPSLAIFDRCLFDQSADPDPRLVWRVAFGNRAGTEAFVDAHTGGRVAL